MYNRITIKDVQDLMEELKAKNPRQSIDRTAALSYLSGLWTGLQNPDVETVRSELNLIFDDNNPI